MSWWPTHADEDHGVLCQAPQRARAPHERQQGALLLGQVGLSLQEAEREAYSPGMYRVTRQVDY